VQAADRSESEEHRPSRHRALGLASVLMGGKIASGSGVPMIVFGDAAYNTGPLHEFG